MKAQQPAQTTGIADFDGAPGASAAWVTDLQERLGWQDRGKAYQALIAMLHALRDHLPADEVVYLGAELPILLRGLYYGGWHPRQRPLSLDDRQTFLSQLHEALHRDVGVDPEQVARAVLAMLSQRISAPELEDVKAACPQPLHGLWPG